MEAEGRGFWSQPIGGGSGWGVLVTRFEAIPTLL